MQLAAMDDMRLCHTPLVVTLMQEKLVDKQYVDHAASRLVRQHNERALDFLDEFFDEVLSSDRVMAFHSDYVLIYDALRAASAFSVLSWAGTMPSDRLAF